MDRGFYGKVPQSTGGINGSEGDLGHVQEALIGQCREVIQTGQGHQRGKFGSGEVEWRQHHGRVGQVPGIQYCFCINLVLQWQIRQRGRQWQTCRDYGGAR